MKHMPLKAALVAAAFATAATTGVAYAQYRDRDRDQNPLEDFLGRIGRDNPNRPLTCNVSRRLGRDGDIVWLRMECRANR